MTQETTRWGTMASDWMNTWAETNSQMWKSWFSLMGTTPASTQDSVADAQQPAYQYLVQRYVDNQELLLRLLRLSFKTWQDLFPKVEAGENWQQAFNNYTEQVRTQLNEFSSGTLKVTQDAAELWQLYLRETQKFNQLWFSALGSSIGPLSQTVTGTSEPWLELNNLYWDLIYEESFGSLMQSPILGPTRELNGKLIRSFDAWTKLYRASIDYQVVLSDVQIRSFEELMIELVSRAEKGETVQDWREFQRLWGQIADDVFEKAFCSEVNLKVRGNFLNSLNTYRLHQQELMEVWMKAMDIPLRGEVDEVHKNIYEMRKVVKTLKKTAAQYEARLQTMQESHAQEVKALRTEIEVLRQMFGKYESQMEGNLETLNQTLAAQEAQTEENLEALKQTLSEQEARTEENLEALEQKLSEQEIQAEENSEPETEQAPTPPKRGRGQRRNSAKPGQT